MNVSIDLSQNQSHKVNLVENNYFKNISSKSRKEQGNTKKRIATFSNEERRNSNKGQKCIEEQIQEEDTEKERSTKRKSSRKTPNKKANEGARIEGVVRRKRKSSQDSANATKGKGDFGTKFPPVEEETKNLSNNSIDKKEDLKKQQKYPGIFDSVEFDDLPLEFSNMNEESQDIDEGLISPAPQNVGQRLDTIETDLSALNLSPRSKASKKLKKLIKMTFKKFNKAPDTTREFYRVGKVLGRGAFGKVNLTIHRLTEEMVAIKSLNKEFLTDEVSRQKVMKEVKILKKMRHKNIIQLLDTFETQKHIIFVMELCSGGDLLNYVRKRRKLTEDNAKPLFKQILEALQYCHRLNILHRDIKLDNIILDSEGVIKVGDFGVSKIINPKEVMYDQCGTPAYIAPEILRDKGYRGFGIDVWSAGVVLYAMLYGTVPFRAQGMNELHEMIVNAKYSLKPEISEEARDLLKKILEVDPKKRLTIPQILDHPWFKDCDDNLEVFTDIEKEKIKQEFSYGNVRKEYKNNETDVSCDFTEHHLETCENDELRNLSTKSIILAPFNSTTSDVPSELRCDRKVIKFNAKCRDFNRQYEMNNNCDLDNGVYNKFMESSRASLHFSDSQNDGLSGGNSIELSFNKEKDLQEFDDEEEMDHQIEEEIKLQQDRIEKGELSEFEMIKQEAENNQLDKEEIDPFLVDEISKYGYPQTFITTSLSNNDINYATASYYILKKQLLVNKNHPLAAKSQNFVL
nr:snf1-related protein kinase [Euplotes vannus]